LLNHLAWVRFPFLPTFIHILTMKILYIIIKILCIIIPLLLAVAYFTLAERKILGAIQRRRGPNVIGAFGLTQPLADGLKLVLKEVIIPNSSNKILFILSPMFTFFISLLGWAVIPFNKHSILVDIDFSLLYILAISSLGVYGIIMSGWSSNSKYAFLGALRSTAQMVSYEVSIGLILSVLLLNTGSLNIYDLVIAQEYGWNIISFLPLFLLFFISALAETNRHPFDLPEAEAELVSGYNVEYSAVGFAFFSLGEYSNMLLMSACTTLFFLGGWLSPLPLSDYSTIFTVSSSIWFGLKMIILVIIYVWIRAALPRYRYDQLMGLGWKVFFPVSLCYLILVFSTLISFNALP
jgi:NADH-quinone oxidoreductase subunit H